MCLFDKQIPPAYIAAASVLAGVAVALVGFQLAVGASVTWPAGARVAALARVGARGAIGAGLVVGAVVEVLVAEESPPSLLAITLPRLATRPVQAAGVAHALGAGGALPAHATLAAPRGLAVAVLLAAVRRADGWMGEEGGGYYYNGYALLYVYLTNTRTKHPSLTPTRFQTSLLVRH